MTPRNTAIMVIENVMMDVVMIFYRSLMDLTLSLISDLLGYRAAISPVQRMMLMKAAVEKKKYGKVLNRLFLQLYSISASPSPLMMSSLLKTKTMFSVQHTRVRKMNN